VLSSVDPDGVISRFQMGCVATSYDDIKHHLIESGSCRAAWDAYGRKGRRYVQLHHGASEAVEVFIQVMAEAMKRYLRIGGWDA
jgi:hypothetical protein